MALITRPGKLIQRPAPGRSIRTISSTTSRLVGWWTMESQDISGTTLFDRSGRRNAGTLAGSPGLVAGKIGQALSFNGSTQYVVATGTFGGGSNRTIAVWVKFNAIGAGFNSNIVEWDDDAANDNVNGWGMQLLLSNNNICFGGAFTDITSSLPISASIVTTGIWYHLVETYDGANLRLFVNGRQDANSPVANANIMRGAGNVISVGTNYSSNGRFLNGSVDDVRVYDRTLSPAEVLALYNRPMADYAYDSDRINRLGLLAAAAGGPAWAARVMAQV